MLTCYCSLDGSTACLTCERYLEETRRNGSTVSKYMSIPATPTQFTYYYNYETPILDKFKKKLKDDIGRLETYIQEYLKENNYRGADRAKIEIEAYKYSLKLIENMEREK